jgi:tRNA nucleotidyltransferase (CCA-adding enzyme)
LTHSIQVLERVAVVSGDIQTRLCAFFHDIGKLYTDPLLYPKHHGHDEAGFREAAELCKRLALPRDYGRALAWISRLHGNANRISELRPATKIRMAEQAIKAGITDMLPIISAADQVANGFHADDWRQVVRVARMSSSELGIDAGKLVAIRPDIRSDYILQKRVATLKQLLL